MFTLLVIIIGLYAFLGIIGTIVSWVDLDESDDYFIFKLIFVPIFGALTNRHDLTLFGKILSIIADIIFMPTHLFCTVIALIVLGIYKICVRDGSYEEDFK